MSKVEKAIKWMENTAKNPIHGYDQSKRWGPDYDCSSMVITAWQTAGVPVKDNGATYSGNSLSVFKNSGFYDVTKDINLSTGVGLERGDVLIHVGKHMAMACGDGKIVQASINEMGKAIGGKTGDQTGKEISIRSYYNYPWTNVLRYKEETGSKKKSVKKPKSQQPAMPSPFNNKGIEPSESFDKSAKSGKKFKVTAGRLNLRPGPEKSDKYKPIAVLENGNIVLWYGYYTNDWLLIKYKDLVGYVALKYLQEI